MVATLGDYLAGYMRTAAHIRDIVGREHHA